MCSSFFNSHPSGFRAFQSIFSCDPGIIESIYLDSCARKCFLYIYVIPYSSFENANYVFEEIEACL